MRLYHWTILLALVALGGVLLGANGLKQGPTKVAVCDIRRALVEYQKFVDMKAVVKKTQDDAAAELENRRTLINALIDQRKELKRGSADDKKLEDQILERSVEAQAYGEVVRNRLERQQYEGIRECYQEVLKAINACAKENAVDVIFSIREIETDEAQNSQDLETMIAARYVLYNGSDLDVTELVLKRLNDAYKPNP